MQIIYIVLPSATHATTMPLWGVQPPCPQQNIVLSAQVSVNPFLFRSYHKQHHHVVIRT